MHELIRTLLANGPVITDGGWGTQLQARGLPMGACPDEWNLTHPERVGEIPAAYVDAGSQIVLTNTFGANRLALADTRWPTKWRRSTAPGRRSRGGRWTSGPGSSPRSAPAA